MKYDCVVIGAGASGLIASRELSNGKKNVLILEGRNRIGGRIYTIKDKNFSQPVEGGAEFIHGELPITSALLHEAHVQSAEMQGEIYQVEKNRVKESDFFNDDWEHIIEKLHELKDDIPFANFLKRYFSENTYLINDITKFVEGYNAADITKVSSFALRDEWSQEVEPIQYRPIGGYGQLMDHLLKTGVDKGLQIHLNKIVTEIDWQPKHQDLKIEVDDGTCYTATQVLITVPLGVLQSEKIKLPQSLREHVKATKRIGFGPVIKFIFEFYQKFWQDEVERKMPALKFIFSDAQVPTWWSQLPSSTPILTGWLAGPLVMRTNRTDDQLYRMAIESLSYLLQTKSETISTQVKAFHIENWIDDQMTAGAYSFDLLTSKEAKALLNSPVDNRIFFCGEGLYRGPHTGTVEAALSSGQEAARKMLRVS